MWTAMVIVGFLGMVIFLVIGVISAIRKNGKSKKQFLTSLAGVLLFLVGAFNVGDIEQAAADLPEYKIVVEKEKSGDGRVHKTLRVSTKASEEQDLRAIVEDVQEKNKNIDAVWLWIHEVDNNPNGNGYGVLKASARFGHGKLGLAAVDVKTSDEYFFEMENTKEGSKEIVVRNNDENHDQTKVTDETTKQAMPAAEIDRYKQYATRLRGGSFLKSAEIEGNSGSIEILASYEEFKKLEPASTIEEKQFNDYWNTGDAINKTLMEEPVRLLREFPELQKVDFTILSVGKTYTVELDRETAEQYFKVNLKDLHEDKSLDKWREQISAKYFTPEERAKYVEQFVKVK